MNRWHNQYLDSHHHFCTYTVSEWQPHLVGNTKVIYEEWETSRKILGIRILAYVIMPEHIHLILWSESGDNIKAFLQRTLSITARRLNDGDKRFWKERPRVLPIEKEAVLRVKIKYLHDNPVRRGLVEAASDWEHSSVCQHETGNPGQHFTCDSWDSISY